MKKGKFQIRDEDLGMVDKEGWGRMVDMYTHRFPHLTEATETFAKVYKKGKWRTDIVENETLVLQIGSLALLTDVMELMYKKLLALSKAMKKAGIDNLEVTRWINLVAVKQEKVMKESEKMTYLYTRDMLANSWAYKDRWEKEENNNSDE